MSRKRHYHGHKHQLYFKDSVHSTSRLMRRLASQEKEGSDSSAQNIQHQHFSVNPFLLAASTFFANLDVVSADVTIFFSKNNTQYKTFLASGYGVFDELMRSFGSGEKCGASSEMTSSVFLSLEKWTYQNSVIGEFFRGLNQLAQEEFEACIKNLIQAAYDTYENQLKSKNHNDTTNWPLIIGVGSVGVVALTVGAYFLYRKVRQYRHDRHVDVGAGLEANVNASAGQGASAASASAAPEASEKEPLLSQKNLFTIKQELKKLTLAERLKVIGVNIDKYPEAKRFICPITQEVMEDPVITDDGNSYERTALEVQKEKSGSCPLNREKHITFMVPNNNLKGQIIEFVEAREAEAKNKVLVNNNNVNVSAGGLRHSM